MTFEENQSENKVQFLQSCQVDVTDDSIEDDVEVSKSFRPSIDEVEGSYAVNVRYILFHPL